VAPLERESCAGSGKSKPATRPCAGAWTEERWPLGQAPGADDRRFAQSGELNESRVRLSTENQNQEKMFGGKNQIGISEPGRAKNEQRKSMNKIGPTKIRSGLLPPRREMRGLTGAIREQEKWIYITK
jgi:hypothetical protein